MTGFHYMGRYSGDPESLVTHGHEPGAVPFKEAENMNKLSLLMNICAVVIAAVTLVTYFLLSGQSFDIIGIILTLVVTVPHEFLHGLCFPGEVYMYENLRKGMLFVVGPGTFSKGRFVFMSMLPNIVFGFIPFIIFLFDHSQTMLGTLGALSIASGAGDYYNVYNALTQMPKGSRTYLHGMHSFWYMPQQDTSGSDMEVCG